MSKAKHTPGPWVVCVQDGDKRAFSVFAESQLEDGLITADDWDYVVATAGLNWKNFEANADLIAAAPDLLEQSEILVGKLKTMAIHASHYAPLEAAIAKATGAMP